MHINNSLLPVSPSYESIKFNVQTLKWAEETYFCIMNSVKKPTNAHKDSLPLSTQAFNRRYSCLNKNSHLPHFSEICLYLKLRFNEFIKATEHTRVWFLLLPPCTSLAEMLSYDFHSFFHRTTAILKLMNLFHTTAVRAHMAWMYQHTFQAASAHNTIFYDLSSLPVLLWVFHPLMLLL